MLKSKLKAEQKLQKAKTIIAQRKCHDARELTRQQMMVDESQDDPGGHHEDGEHNEANETYADFDEDDSDDVDPSETREEYDSEEDENQPRRPQ